ncbi:GLL12 protein, partial [Bucco capensis]|nr:GLL12 protein [Bucco capensis]
MRMLWLLLLFISLSSHGDAAGPGSCGQAAGLCRVGSCASAEYLASFCFQPIILCCKPWPST